MKPRLCSVLFVKNVQAVRARKKCRETQDRDECCPSSWLLVDERCFNLILKQFC